MSTPAQKPRPAPVKTVPITAPFFLGLVERMPNLRLGPIGQRIQLIGTIEHYGRDAVMHGIENFLIAEHWIVSEGKEREIT